MSLATYNDLKGLREAVLRRADWPNAPESGTAKVDAFINDAIDQISLDAPFLFNETFLKISTEPDVGPDNDDDTLTLFLSDPLVTNSINPYVMSRGLDTTDAVTIWATDRSWGGRYIDLELDDGTTFTTQIRTVWIENDFNGTGIDRYCISLLHPFPWAGHAVEITSWRIYTPVYYFPDDVIEFRSLRLVGSTMPSQLRFISQDEAESAGILDVSGEQSGGMPTWAYRRGHFQLPGMNSAAGVALHASREWIGPEPPGEFEYAYTVCWGKRDYRRSNLGPGGFETINGKHNESDDTVTSTMDLRNREPMFESGPARISESITSPSIGVAGPTTGSAIIVAFPNLSYELGFQFVGESDGTSFQRMSVSHSGMHLRIYRRRLSADFTNYDQLGGTGDGNRIDGLLKLDIQDDFYLLAEFQPNQDNQALFIDDGLRMPDKSRRLRDSHGYQGIGLYPPANAVYDLEARVLRRPTQLSSDSDVPNIHPEACTLIVDHACSMLYEMLKDPGMAEASRVRYRENLQSLVKRYSDLRPDITPVRKKPARSWRYKRASAPWWRTQS